MKRLLLVFLSFLVFEQVHAQRIINVTASNSLSTIGAPADHYSPPILTDKNTENIADAFYGGTWHTGYVIINDSTKSNVVKLAYNTQNGELLLIEDDKKMSLPASALDGFVLTELENRTVFKNGYKSKFYDISTEQMMRVVFDDGIQIIAKETSDWKQRGGGPLGQIRYQIIPETTYFVVKNDGKLRRIKLNKKNVLALFKNERKEVEQYAIDHQLDFAKESDLKKILSQTESF